MRSLGYTQFNTYKCHQFDEEFIEKARISHIVPSKSSKGERNDVSFTSSAYSIFITFKIFAPGDQFD